MKPSSTNLAVRLFFFRNCVWIRSLALRNTFSEMGVLTLTHQVCSSIRPFSGCPFDVIKGHSFSSYRLETTGDWQKGLNPKSFPDGCSVGATPDPIPNSEVKPYSADDTTTWWESRSSSGILCPVSGSLNKRIEYRAFFFLAHSFRFLVKFAEKS